ncbi:glycoside hydrolase family 97 protein [Ferruginibacter sp. HRS2-29]|uniref:glycoside hydrolase family 97 protein n=1 Tax=Ferruginibacter sp. HRS2-29 TaxID=2487334 RepID=UPI0020CEF61C|nr:glycoside hydrolase family 97 protein [Ferruginibacter sp. HRS2-29]MCP9753476.1 glycoside hydrolase family 97 protein [Ferruginibacter sp. HRS2-29]
MRLKIVLFLAAVCCIVSARSQKPTVLSPNQKIMITLFNEQNMESGEWYLTASYSTNGIFSQAIPRIALGLSRSDQDFSTQLKCLKVSRPVLINELYSAIHGKKSSRSNSANEVIVSFENPSKAKLNIIIRAYNDGVTFRYEFPEKEGSFRIKDELTSYSIPKETTRWMEKWNPANEGLYTAMSGDKIQMQEWCYPALFKLKDSSCYFLLHESDLNSSYCGTKLSNLTDSTGYKLSFPNPKDGRGTGESMPMITLPWKSPWRVIIMGSLSDIVASTLVDDVATPSVIKNTSWIKPGVVSWNYWSDNHGTKDYRTVTAFADLAAEMNWTYTLLDWEWDSMTNGGNVEDAAKYILSKGVKPLIWYNSGGNHTWVSATPKDRMLTHENRVEEFTKLKKMGFAGVKIDFFESEKQDMIKYYLDILQDAAQFEMMVYFHGCMVPRGWARTYPNLMTYEAVRGAEWYNNGPEFTVTAPEHNATLPFTRNVVGAMDYTPVTFTNSQFPHTTSYGHELALSVLFESGLQHFADRPEGYHELPDAIKTFLKNVPNAWDDTKLLDGIVGEEVTIARRKETAWYVAGITATQRKEKTRSLKFDFLQEGIKYKLTLISDGKHDKDFLVQYSVVDKNTSLNIKLLRRGGFAASLIPLQ